MSPSVVSTPGSRFQTARKRAKLTQKEVAAAAGVAQSTVSDFETGQIGDILATHLVHMCVAVNATAEYILLGSRAARDDEEAEAITLLRGAGETERRQAMKSLRGMLAPEVEPSRKRAAAGGG